MKHIKTFEDINKKFKIGDYVYPHPEHTKSSFQVLKPIKYQVIGTHMQFGHEWLELDKIDVSKHINQFDPDWFLSETEYEANKYNL